MKKLIIFIFLFFNSSAFSISCNNYDKYNQSVSSHLSIASAVYLGTVIEAKFDHENIDGSEIELGIQVNHVFKGSPLENTKLVSSLEYDDPIVIGYSYVFFNYSEDRLDSICGYLFKIGPFVSSLELLEIELQRSKLMGYFEQSESLKGIEVLLNIPKKP